MPYCNTVNNISVSVCRCLSIFRICCIFDCLSNDISRKPSYVALSALQNSGRISSIDWKPFLPLVNLKGLVP